MGKSKRANGEGAVHQRKDGRWEGKITVGYDPLTGKMKRKSFTSKLQSDVIIKINAVKSKLYTNTYVDDKKQTVRDWLEYWLEYCMKPKVRISTWESYESVVRCHLIPTIGNKQLQALQASDVQKLYKVKLSSGRIKDKTGLSNTTVSYIHAVLKQALTQAVKEQVVVRNIMDAVSKPKPVRHQIQPLTIEQIKTFLKFASGHRFELAYSLECYTGLRRGELLGLRWQDVDFDKGTISVRQSLIRTRQGLMISEPKTDNAIRVIPLPSEQLDRLSDSKKDQDKKRALAGKAYTNHDLIFCNDFGHPIDPRNFVRQFERLLAKAKLPKISFHDLRHSHATMLLTLNEHPKVVQERLGHSTIAMTLDTYSHVLPGLQQRATEKINDALKDDTQDDDE